MAQTEFKKNANTAEVSLPEALVFDPARRKDDKYNPDDPHTWPTLKAKDFDKEKHEGLEFYCPCCLDKKDKLVKLQNPKKEHPQKYAIKQKHYNPATDVMETDKKTGEPQAYRYYTIPAHFPVDRDFAHVCDFAQRQSLVTDVVRKIKGVKQGEERPEDKFQKIHFYIPDGTVDRSAEDPFGLRPSAGDDFGSASKHKRRRIKGEVRTVEVDGDEKVGVWSIKTLAKVLDASKMDKQVLSTVPYGIGADEEGSLGDIYHRKIENIYNEIHAQQEKPRLSDRNKPIIPEVQKTALFRFIPSRDQNNLKTKKKEGAMIIPSFQQDLFDSKGRCIKVTTSLRIQGSEAISAFLKSFETIKDKKGAGLLIYSGRFAVDHAEHDKQIMRAKSYSGKIPSLRLIASVTSAKQFMIWEPPSPQLGLFSGFTQKPLGQPEEEFLI